MKFVLLLLLFYSSLFSLVKPYPFCVAAVLGVLCLFAILLFVFLFSHDWQATKKTTKQSTCPTRGTTSEKEKEGEGGRERGGGGEAGKSGTFARVCACIYLDLPVRMDIKFRTQRQNRGLDARQVLI